MQESLSFRAPLGAVFSSSVLFAACVFVTWICFIGMQNATGLELMIITVTSLFPLLMSIAALLRLISIASRRIELVGPDLVHRQVFKNYTVPVRDIIRIEARRGQNGEIDTIRILWSGTPFYVDQNAIVDFEGFLRGLEGRSERALLTYVTEFSPSG